MAPEELKLALIEATLPLLMEHGRTVTTKQIASAAGVAEGTIFRVFESKDELIMASLEHAFALEPFLNDLRRIEPNQPLRDLVGDLVTTLQIRFRGVFGLMAAVGMVGPPKAHRHDAEPRRVVGQEMVRLLSPYADQLTCPVEHLVHVTRLLTFSGTHPHISDGQTLTPEQIVGTILDGVLREDHSC